MKQLPKGIITAMITPFSKKGGFDEKGFRYLIDRQIKSGISALLILGTTGESPTLSIEEKERIFKTAREVCPLPLLFGCGANDTKKAVENAKRCEGLGADFLLAVTPYYNKCTSEGLIEYYSAIHRAVSTPIIAYNVPSRTGVKMEEKTIEFLYKKGIICGIKEADSSLSCALRLSDKLPLYTGNDEYCLPLFSVGAHGCISVLSNLFPSYMVALYESFLRGDVSFCKRIYHRILPLANALFIQPNPIPVKRAMELLHLPAGKPRSPLTRLGKKQEKQLVEGLFYALEGE